MGLDMHIMAAKSVKELDEMTWSDWTKWEDVCDKYDGDFTMLERPCAVWYARKFWDMMHEMSFLTDYECGEWVHIHKDDLQKMINFYCYHPDYFDGFNGLPRLCELYQAFDALEDAGINLYFEADW